MEQQKLTPTERYIIGLILTYEFGKYLASVCNQCGYHKAGAYIRNDIHTNIIFQIERQLFSKSNKGYKLFRGKTHPDLNIAMQTWLDYFNTATYMFFADNFEFQKLEEALGVLNHL